MFLSGSTSSNTYPRAAWICWRKTATCFHCAEGQLFFQAGRLGNSLYVLEKGRVRTFRSYGDKALRIARPEAPAIFGELGCFGQGKYHFSAEAFLRFRVRLISLLGRHSETILPRPASILVAPYVFLEGLLDRIDLSLRLSVVHCYRTIFASTLFRGTNATRPQRYWGVPQVLRKSQLRRLALDYVTGIVSVKTSAMSG
jgi:hypothetical protein